MKGHATNLSVGNCPQCAGPLDFKLKSSVQCVCPYCGSLVAREGDSLRNFGVCADVLASVSPLRLGTMGIHHQRSFEVIGRRQITWEHGFWEEWHVAFGKSENGWLTDAQGCYAFLRPSLTPPQNISLDVKRGHRFSFSGKSFEVVDVKKARVSAVEGELPSVTPLGRPFVSIDCVDAKAHLCTVELAESERVCSIGAYVLPSSLELRFTREDCNEWR